MKKNVALLVGGWSTEREVSLLKGEHIEKGAKPKVAITLKSLMLHMTLPS